MTDHPAEPTLLDKVDELTRSVDRVTVAFEAETEALRLKFFTARRAFRIAVAAMILGFVGTVSLIWVVRREVERRETDRTAAAVVSCLNANESRQAIEDRMEQLVTQLGNTNPPTDPAAKAVRDQVIDKFIADFRAAMPVALRPRDCSPQAATSPTLVQR